MKKPIEWSFRATPEYLDTIDFLLGKWGERVAKNFANRLHDVLGNISERPQM